MSSKKNHIKTGCIDVGGGVRDIYGAGIFDYLIDKNIRLDYCIGVSAGSANCASYVARQRGRNLQFYSEYLTGKDSIGFKKYLKDGSFIDLDYVYGTLSNTGGKNPLDYPALIESETEFEIVATDAVTGKPAYFDKHNDISQNNYRALMASSALPVFCKPVEINGREYYDGGLSDPIPYKKALEDGCGRLIVILTKPVETLPNHGRNTLGAEILKKKYPAFSDSMRIAAQVYTGQLNDVLDLQEKGRALVLAPDDIMGLSTLSKDKSRLMRLYSKGYSDAKKITEFLDS